MTVRVVAVDPGLASTGIAALERTNGVTTVLRVALVKTMPDHEKGFRKASDDQRRLGEIWRAVHGVVDEVKPHCMGVETYTVMEPRDAIAVRSAAEGLLGTLGQGAVGGQASALRAWLAGEGFPQLLAAGAELRTALDIRSTIAGRGQAAKTILIYGAVMCIALERGVNCYPWMPLDVKTRVAGKRGASKDEVEEAVYTKVAGARAALAAAAPKSQRNHVADAVALALLSLDQYERDATAFTSGTLR